MHVLADRDPETVPIDLVSPGATMPIGTFSVIVGALGNCSIFWGLKAKNETIRSRTYKVVSARPSCLIFGTWVTLIRTIR
jgi:hypothetical protein